MVLNNERALKRSDSLVVSVERSLFGSHLESRRYRAHTNFGYMTMEEVFVDLPDVSKGTDTVLYSVVRKPHTPSWKSSRQCMAISVPPYAPWP